MDKLMDKVKDKVLGDHGDSDDRREEEGGDEGRREQHGYSREEGHARREERSYEEEGQGYSSHGGRSGAARAEDDRYDSEAREHRPHQGGSLPYDDDYSGAQEHAERHAGSSGDSSLFATALGLLGGRKQEIHSEQDDDIDEEKFVKAHKKVYHDEGEADSNDLGSAAVMQALKMFTQGSGGSGKEASSSNAFVGMAMAEAAKMFDQKGGAGGADKQQAVNQAAQLAMKMFVKSQGGKGGSSSSSGLLSLASKFM